MSINNTWINSYHSVMRLSQDPITGKLTGTYSSTTGGTGTYNVVGWAALLNPTESAGQPMAISILWRSNDGGKSDPSHEVSGMAGQVILSNNAENLSLVHLFVETDPIASKLAPGFYPDKLIFAPYQTSVNTANDNRNELVASIQSNDSISGIWVTNSGSEIVQIKLAQTNLSDNSVEGTILYQDGSLYPIIGYTDSFAVSGKLNLQGLTLSSFIDKNGTRTCISMSGYLDLEKNIITLTRLLAHATDSASNYTQVLMEALEFKKQG
jgi:hypothetical protein